ncbi:MAG: sigma-54-dependent Fis family transcriptional regulator [Kiritimatiellae bacterium]|nr:sigma-54-dependent Fis family transcriptional regulator [Kiritimatiellia bacterium]
MNKNLRLKAAERDFLALVARATFANPFSDERVELDLAITGLPRQTPTAQRVDRLSAKVTAFLIELEKKGPLRTDMFCAEDRALLENGFLFEVFHQYIDAFDALILEQVQARETSCAVPFAKDLLARLVKRGFPRREAVRYFAIFYQLRRAYYFVDRALIGRSRSMKQLRRNLWNDVFTHDLGLYERYLWNRMEDFSTLLLGETGTGKGAAATAIGRSEFIPFDEKRQCFAESFMHSFIAINLSQYPESLIESELFGHRKGAFTGAVEAHEGVLARCSPHGAIFLDEIGDVSIPIQLKLLQVLEQRVFSPVGSHERHQFRGRIIAATNRPLDALRRDKLFRDDFFYRLCSDMIVVPPLRQRLQEEPGELDELLAHTVRRLIGEEAPDVVGMVGEAIRRDVGKDYTWPGNVRELEQCVRRILLTRRYDGAAEAPAPDLRERLLTGMETGAYDAPGLLSDYCTLLHRRHGTYEEVARRTGLDRRTVKKYIERAAPRGRARSF